jgi:hypothetical protein
MTAVSRWRASCEFPAKWYELRRSHNPEAITIHIGTGTSIRVGSDITHVGECYLTCRSPAGSNPYLHHVTQGAHSAYNSSAV